MAARKTKKHGRLGSNLEPHGSKIRVVLTVPPSLRPVLGKSHLKKSLPTDSPKVAERLKHAVLHEFQQILHEARFGTKDDPAVMEAFSWREALQQEDDDREGGTQYDLLLSDRIDELRELGDAQTAQTLVSIAVRRETPISALVEQWITDSELVPSVAARYRRGISLFTDWCIDASVAATVELITSKVAMRFRDEVFRARGVNHNTANGTITALSSYWTWLLKKEHLDPDKRENVWTKKRLPKPKKYRQEEESDKRPFSDKEAKTLLEGVTKQPMADMQSVAALSGMRISEIAHLRVRHIVEGQFRVRIAKSDAGQRDVPIHPDLADLIARRSRGKDREGYLFHELSEQRDPARSRAAPISQAFTRARRELGVDEKARGSRQSRIDFHSWRRWFIRKGVEALEQGATGFTGWTIADVVGHSKEEGPLPMTMGRYPGTADETARRACVEAVRLPT
jgi:integrase